MNGHRAVKANEAAHSKRTKARREADSLDHLARADASADGPGRWCAGECSLGAEEGDIYCAGCRDGVADRRDASRTDEWARY